MEATLTTTNYYTHSWFFMLCDASDYVIIKQNLIAIATGFLGKYYFLKNLFISSESQNYI